MNLEIAFILLLIGLQFYVFLVVHRKIRALGHFFPDSFQHVSIRRKRIHPELLSNAANFNAFLTNLSADSIADQLYRDDSEEVELLYLSEKTASEHPLFAEVIRSTNAYLCKNKGTAADVNILQDTCERNIEKADNEIAHLIHVPLYIGLGGTFIGIIVGLWGIDFSAATREGSSAIASFRIDTLLQGVIYAMLASLAGLTFTVVNSAVFYKPAAYRNETGKSLYYDFLQRELLPHLTIGMAKTLGNFRDVLNAFIGRFGENMDDYKESGLLLSENLQKQHSILEEINKLSLTKTSTQIADLFVKLNDSSDHLEQFITYQKELNGYVDKTGDVTREMGQLIGQFSDFNGHLRAISSSTLATIDLQKQFKDSLERHFPVIDDHREIWRKQVESFHSDALRVFEELQAYFQSSTQMIRQHAETNSDLFLNAANIRDTLRLTAEQVIIQKETAAVFRSEITSIRTEVQQLQRESMETNRELVAIMRELKQAITRNQPLA